MPDTAIATIHAIYLDEISESATNPRTTFEEIDELAEDIGRRGVISPVLVRPIPDGPRKYELVFGARRFRAAARAQLQRIPAMVRELTDDEVAEIQLVENSKRRDLAPLEEAEGIRQLQTRFGLTAEQIAQRIGKGVGLVYRRIKICGLVDEAKAALADGRLSIGAAEALARVSEDRQAAALESMLNDRWQGGTVDADDAREYVCREFLLPLARAPFDLSDKRLGDHVPACTACPKRTGAQTALFEDLVEDEHCTDRACYDAKVAASWDRKKAELTRAGHKVLEGKDADKALAYNSEYVRLDNECQDVDEGDLVDEEIEQLGPAKTWKQVLGGDAPKGALVRDRNGDVVELVKRDDLRRAVQEHRPELVKLNPELRAFDGPRGTRATDEQILEGQARGEARKRAIVKAAEKAAKGGASLKALRFIASNLDSAYWGGFADVTERRGMDSGADDLIEHMSEGDLVGFIVEVLAHQNTDVGDAAFATFGVDLAKLEKEAIAAAKAAPAPTSAKPSKKARSK